MVELHTPVILRTYDEFLTPRYFIAKRSESRELFPGKWEFGGAKPNNDEPLIDTLKREYKEDFNVEIKLDINILGYPVPVGMYEHERFYGDQRVLYKGLLFSGQIYNPDEIRITYKHSEFKFVTWEEAKEFDPIDLVPGFLEHLRLQDICWNRNLKK